MSLQNYFFPRKSFNPNLLILPRPCCFSLNNSETVKAVTVTFCSPQYHFIRDICARFDISNSSQSPDIWWNSDGGISYFQISGQSFINKNCHNSRISHDNDIKLGPVTKLDTRNTKTSKKIDDNVMSENCDVIVSFPIHGQFTFSWNRKLLSYKNWKQN